GEDAVLRILDKRHLMRAAGRMSLDGLGFHGDALQALRALARRPHGMLLVTGPTGSGKTTTLYAAVSEVLSDRDKIITIEDPIEYELAGALQIPVNESKGLTFARGLRSILRHDPDTIFVGEIRDAETADIAVQAALTGHLVLTTVHANSVIDVIGRFIHMKLDLFSLVSALGGIVAQRLVRTRCTACAGQAQAAAVCAHCQGSGYHGRTVIAQAVTLDDTCRELIVERAPLGQLKAHLQRIATTDLQTEAQTLIAQGRTTEEEVSRVLAFS
ncbi:MAG TPA: ATPase, T2SS/T4P/T4SS family, partial [Burkholderiaceae bacterium]|nr:ATPase, T2SS/T4P/T4SS family [Burkholderiaceae bacterium]